MRKRITSDPVLEAASFRKQNRELQKRGIETTEEPLTKSSLPKPSKPRDKDSIAKKVGKKVNIIKNKIKKGRR
jgi:hypothetical protein